MDKIADRAMAPTAIRRLRMRLGLTQTELAKKLLVRGNTVWRYEKGSIKPPPQIILILTQIANDAGITDLFEDTADDESSFIPEQTALSACIRDVRVRIKFNQTEFGRLLGVKHNTVSKWEAGQAKPGAHHILKLLDLTRLEDAERKILIRYLFDEFGLNVANISSHRFPTQDAQVRLKPNEIALFEETLAQITSLNKTRASIERAGEVLFTLAQMHGESMAVASGLYRSVCICGKIPHDEFTAELERLAAGGYVQIVRTSEARAQMGAAGYGVSNWIPHSAQPEAILFVKIQPLGLQLIEGTVSPEDNPGAEPL